MYSGEQNHIKEEAFRHFKEQNTKTYIERYNYHHGHKSLLGKDHRKEKQISEALWTQN